MQINSNVLSNSIKQPELKKIQGDANDVADRLPDEKSKITNEDFSAILSQGAFQSQSLNQQMPDLNLSKVQSPTVKQEANLAKTKEPKLLVEKANVLKTENGNTEILNLNQKPKENHIQSKVSGLESRQNPVPGVVFGDLEKLEMPKKLQIPSEFKVQNEREFASLDAVKSKVSGRSPVPQSALQPLSMRDSMKSISKNAGPMKGSVLESNDRVVKDDLSRVPLASNDVSLESLEFRDLGLGMGLEKSSNSNVFGMVESVAIDQGVQSPGLNRPNLSSSDFLSMRSLKKENSAINEPTRLVKKSDINEVSAPLQSNASFQLASPQARLKDALDDLQVGKNKNRSAGLSGLENGVTSLVQQGTAVPLSQERLSVKLDAPVTQGAMNKERLSSEALKGVGLNLKSFVTNQQGGEIRLRLKPDNLGEVRLQVMTSGNRVGLKIHTTDARAKHIIEESLPHLKEQLGSQNLNLSSVDVGIIGIDLKTDVKSDLGSLMNGGGQHGSQMEGQGKLSQSSSDQGLNFGMGMDWSSSGSNAQANGQDRAFENGDSSRLNGSWNERPATGPAKAGSWTSGSSISNRNSAGRLDLMA